MKGLFTREVANHLLWPPNMCTATSSSSLLVPFTPSRGCLLDSKRGFAHGWDVVWANRKQLEQVVPLDFNTPETVVLVGCQGSLCFSFLPNEAGTRFSSTTAKTRPHQVGQYVGNAGKWANSSSQKRTPKVEGQTTRLKLKKDESSEPSPAPNAPFSSGGFFWASWGSRV